MIFYTRKEVFCVFGVGQFYFAISGSILFFISQVSNDNLKYLEENKLFYIVSIGRHQIRRLSGFPSVLLKELGERIDVK